MKKLVLLIILSGAFAGTALAAACISQNLAALTLAGGCSETFGAQSLNWTFGTPVSTAQPSGIAIDPMNIMVTPVITSSFAGFMFNTGMGVVSPNLFQDLALAMTATAGANTTITGAFVQTDGRATGTGQASVTDTFCRNGPVIGCANPQVISAVATANNQVNIAAATFPSSASVAFLKDAGVLAGNNGTALMTFFFQGVNYAPTSPVPEPSTFGLMGLALVGLGVGKRRFMKR